MLKFEAKNVFKRLFSSFSPFPSISNYLNSHIDCFLSGQISGLSSLLQSHAFIITSGHTNNIFISSKLISIYASIIKPNSSDRVFTSVRFKDSFLWNSIIKAHFSNGNYSKALEYFVYMRSETLPNQFTIPLVVASCAELGSVKDGMNVHGLASKLGLFASNSAVGSSFVYMYSKCGCMEDAAFVFDDISLRDVVAWTALLIGYVQNGESEKGLECLSDMHRTGGEQEKPNFRTLAGGFQACGNLGALLEGKCLHGLVLKSGIGSSRVVQSSILYMYSKCGAPEEVNLSFCEVVDKDRVSWTLIIGVYAKLGRIGECISTFLEMLAAGISSDGMVISCVISCFANSLRLYEGKAFHGFIIRRNVEDDQMVHNALLSMYCKFGFLNLAEKLFDVADKQDEESWNIMVYGYGKAGKDAMCIKVFREMQYLGFESVSNSLISVISSCTQLGGVCMGRSLHGYIIKSVIHENVSVLNSLIDMYGKSGNLTMAWRIFCRTQRDTVTWNILISSYTHSGHASEGISLFDKMISEGIKPSSATLITVLSACSRIASLEKGEQVHNYILESRFEFSLPLATALVDMYAKCGQLDKSRQIFNLMQEKDVVAWNVMISGYGMHGYAESAVQTFQLMEHLNVRPNELTFLSVLSACAHSGLVEEGKSLFGRMGEYSLRPTLKHYACMVDLLGRSGKLQEAEALILSMPIAPDGGLWGALLTACKIHNDPEFGVRIATHAIESDPENDGYYVIISDLYGSIGKWEEVEKVRSIMKERGVRKITGWSAM